MASKSISRVIPYPFDAQVPPQLHSLSLLVLPAQLTLPSNQKFHQIRTRHNNTPIRSLLFHLPSPLRPPIPPPLTPHPPKTKLIPLSSHSQLMIRLKIDLKFYVLAYSQAYKAVLQG